MKLQPRNMTHPSFTMRLMGAMVAAVVDGGRQPRPARRTGYATLRNRDTWPIATVRYYGVACFGLWVNPGGLIHFPPVGMGARARFAEALGHAELNAIEKTWS